MPHLMSQKHIVSIYRLCHESVGVNSYHTASLVLIMLAIGAIHLSEYEFAQSAYEASCLLLAQVGWSSYGWKKKFLNPAI